MAIQAQVIVGEVNGSAQRQQPNRKAKMAAVPAGQEKERGAGNMQSAFVCGSLDAASQETEPESYADAVQREEIVETKVETKGEVGNGSARSHSRPNRGDAVVVQVSASPVLCFVVRIARWTQTGKKRRRKRRRNRKSSWTRSTMQEKTVQKRAEKKRTLLTWYR